MAESVLGGVASQSSLLLLDPSKFGFRSYATPFPAIRLQLSSKVNRRLVASSGKNLRPVVPCRVVSSDLEASTIVSDRIDLPTEGIEAVLDTGGGGGSYGDLGGGDSSGGGGGDSSGGGGGWNNGGGEGSSEGNDGGDKKKMAFSMSQKLTLGYAALVGMGGLMGYMKSGSQKSLVAGGVSASILYYVHTQLPTNPVYASAIGMGVSSILLGVMGSRFLKSKKVFPAGVVSLVSLIMTGGYIHGVLRSMH